MTVYGTAAPRTALHSAPSWRILEWMLVSMEFLRGAVGLIGVVCAYMLGRSVAAVRKGWMRQSRVYGWTVRMAACMIALTIRHPVDVTEIAVWCLAAAVLAAGYWTTWRRKPEEDLTGKIFDDQA
jgi:hypothetical protein